MWLHRVHSNFSRRASRFDPPLTPVVETHPDAIVDLRLDAPFQALLEYADEWILDENIDSMSLSHCPYAILLLKALQDFSSDKMEGAKLPSTREEKAEFKELIKSKMSLDLKDPENFDEALAAAYRAYSPTKVFDHELIARYPLKRQRFSQIQNAIPSSRPFHQLYRK
jgi:hypothetical protein